MELNGIKIIELFKALSARAVSTEHNTSSKARYLTEGTVEFTRTRIIVINLNLSVEKANIQLCQNNYAKNV